jgi:hypothetical protein
MMTHQSEKLQRTLFDKDEPLGVLLPAQRIELAALTEILLREAHQISK